MGERLPFDDKNAQDFIENTRKINEALHVIENDPQLAPSKANLAKHSGLNRNTLYHRSLMTCPAERKGESNAADYGWPYRRLLDIKRARQQHELVTAGGQLKEPSLEDRVNQLQQQLNKSRHVAAAWFNRTLDLKKERDAARREAELLRKRLSEREKFYRDEIDRLRTRLKGSIKVLNE